MGRVGGVFGFTVSNKLFICKKSGDRNRVFDRGVGKYLWNF